MWDPTAGPDSFIDTKGLERSAVLTALYNAASKIGLGCNDSSLDMMSESYAKILLMDRSIRQDGKKIYFGFDYLDGKRLKLDLTDENGFCAGQYDYGQGRGTAKLVIEILRATCNPGHPDIIALQALFKEAVKIASTPLRRPGMVTEGTLAEALEITPKQQYDGNGNPTDEKDYEYERLKSMPCTTYDW